MSSQKNSIVSEQAEQGLDKREYSVAEILKERGVSRRDFLKFCSAMTAAMSLPASFAPTVAQALDEVKRPTLVWVEFQGCTGDSEALLRSANPTGAVGVRDAVPGATIINLPGCPCNADNLTATIVHFLVFGKIPALDSNGRPLFAYGKRIHDNCERRPHFDAGQYVEHWGDDAHRKGFCLYKMGCKGPATFHNCPTQRYNEKTSWPVGSGHGCAGCSEPQFWDTMGPLYHRLPNVPGFGIEATADKIGLGLVAGAAAAFAVHGALNALRKDKEPEETKEG